MDMHGISSCMAMKSERTHKIEVRGAEGERRWWFEGEKRFVKEQAACRSHIPSRTEATWWRWLIAHFGRSFFAVSLKNSLSFKYICSLRSGYSNPVHQFKSQVGITPRPSKHRRQF